MKHLCFKQDAPLNSQDDTKQTFGCRHTNSEICSSNRLGNICAFVRSDNVCKKPPRTWGKIFKNLSETSTVQK